MGKNVAQPGLLRRINRSLIIELIFKNKTMSRSALAKITGLALPSIMRLVDGLIEDGLVIDIGKGESSGGRKPALLSLNKNQFHIIGVEIAVQTTVVLTNLIGDVLDEWSTDEMPDTSPNKILEDVKDVINDMLMKHSIDSQDLMGIGIGTPGQNFKYVRDVDYSILKGWESMDVLAYFKKTFDCHIIVDNVARTRTLAELWFGHGKDLNDFIYVFVDQGVGCGIVNEGLISNGYNGVAGEFGHHIVDYKGKACYCGNQGCIEMYVSAGAITASHENKNLGFAELIKSHNNLNEIGLILGIGVVNLVNIINPKAIVLGGIVPLSSDIIFETSKQVIKENIFSNYARDTEVLRSEVSQAGLGSIALVINRIVKET